MSRFIPESDVVDVFFATYSDPVVGGKHDRETFGKNVQKFFDLTFNAYIHGDCEPHGDRDESFAKFVEHIKIGTPRKARQEAMKYFRAVDHVHPYT
jgi:hypothetical protein